MSALGPVSIVAPSAPIATVREVANEPVARKVAASIPIWPIGSPSAESAPTASAPAWMKAPP